MYGRYSTCGLVKPRKSLTFPEGLTVSLSPFLPLTPFRKVKFKRSTELVNILHLHFRGTLNGKRSEEGQDVVGEMVCPGCFPLEINSTALRQNEDPLNYLSECCLYVVMLILQ